MAELKPALNTGLADSIEGLKVDLACGVGLRLGYTGVDAQSLDAIFPDGKVPEEYEGYVQHNLFEMPWPFEDDSVDAVFSSHFVEHIPHYHPNWGADRDGWWVFWEELWRVVKDGAVIEVLHPFSRSDRAFWDPTHVRFIHYQTWFYLSREHRIQLGVNHYAPDIDFEVVSIQSTQEPALLEGRSESALEFARSFYFNPAEDLFVVLKAIKS